MIPYVTPMGVFLLLAVLRSAVPLRGRYTVADAAACSLASMLLLTGGAHFSSMRDEMIAMVPPFFPRPDRLVIVTGVLEFAGVIGLFVFRIRIVVGVALAVLFVALLPANIHAAIAGLTLGGEPVTPLWVRIPEQLLYIAFALAPAWSARRGGGRLVAH